MLWGESGIPVPTLTSGYGGASAAQPRQPMWHRNEPTPPRARPENVPKQLYGGLAPYYGFSQWGAGVQSNYDHRTLPRRAVESMPTTRQRCDRCDQDTHPTERCPFFKNERDRHADAWAHYTPSASSSTAAVQSCEKPAIPARECAAPKFLARGLAQVRRMPGDGACLFHAVAHGLNGLGYREDGYSVRRRVAYFISARPELEISGTPLRSWVEWDSSMSVTTYASRLAAGEFWGGAIEMAACARAFAVDLAVYEEDYGGSGFYRISDFLTDAEPRGFVLLLYSGRSHYDALQPLARSTLESTHQQDLQHQYSLQYGQPANGYYASTKAGGVPQTYTYQHYKTENNDEDDWCGLM